MRVGIIGCGNISDVYVRNAKLFNDIEIVACSDILPPAAERLAHKYSLRENTSRVAHPQNRRKDIRRDQLSPRESCHSELPFAWSRGNGKCYSRGTASPVLGSLRVARTGGNARDH